MDACNSEGAEDRFIPGIYNYCEEDRMAAHDLAVYLGPHGDDLSSVVSFDLARLVVRARGYGDEVLAWQRERPVDASPPHVPDPAFPQDVIDHFALTIGSKIWRAAHGASATCRSAELDRSDANGSAKVAILAAERSRDAWRDLRGSGLATEGAISRFEEQLTWVIGELDHLFPQARAFVRPGFDEPP